MIPVLDRCFSIACAESRCPDDEFADFIELAFSVVDDRLDDARRILSTSNIDSENLWNRVSLNKLKNLFANCPELTTILSPPVKELFEQHLARQRALQQRYTSELTKLVRGLENAHVPVLSLKGPILGQRLYGQPIRRSFSDLDLLVDQTRLDEAIALFDEFGYALKGERSGVSSHRLRANHAVNLRRGDIKLDLHWHFRNVPSYRIDMQDVWETRRTVEFAGQRIDAISDEYSLLLLLLSTVDDIANGKLRLKHMLDLDVMVRSLGSEWDWQQFLTRRACDNTLSACVNGLAVLEGISRPGRLPSKLRQELQAYDQLVVTREPTQCRQLLLQPNKSFLTWVWACQAYRTIRQRPVDIWKLNVPHLGSMPRAICRCSLRSVQTIQFLCSYRRLAGLLQSGGY